MKNYSRKTSKSLTRYRTPATFRLRAVLDVQKTRLDNRPDQRYRQDFKK